MSIRYAVKHKAFLYDKLNDTCNLLGSYYDLLEDRHIGDVTMNNIFLFLSYIIKRFLCCHGSVL